jgi:hypothetical protein
MVAKSSTGQRRPAFRSRFNDEWQHQWEVLDDALRVSVEGLGSLGKKIAPAFIAMIDSKFATSPSSRYVERGAL